MRDIKGYEGLYAVTEDGRVWSYRRKKFLSTDIKKNGYIYVTLCENNKQKKFYVHRLVASTFIPNPNNYETVDHINGDKTNNKVENLQWLDNATNVAKGRSKPVIHLETGKIYISATEASKSLRLDKSDIAKAAKGKLRSVKNQHFKYVDEIDAKEIIWNRFVENIDI